MADSVFIPSKKFEESAKINCSVSSEMLDEKNLETKLDFLLKVNMVVDKYSKTDDELVRISLPCTVYTQQSS